MDAFYNNDAAAAALENFASARREALTNRNDARIIHMAEVDSVQENRITISEAHQGRQTWRICARESEDEVKDEIVFRLQGVLKKNNLVPKNLASCPRAKAPFLSQQAEICGLGSETFNESLAKIAVIHDLFSQQLAGVEMTPMGERGGGAADVVSASNRIFTLRADVPTEQDNDFQRGVDPVKLLAKMKTGELIHAPENIVTYFKRAQKEDNETYTYDEFVPGGFKVGDIVEMQLCFVAMASARNTVKVTMRLQALTLLDDQFTKAATAARKEAAGARPAPTAMRRKVGYFREDEDDERRVKKSRSSSPGGEAVKNTVASRQYTIRGSEKHLKSEIEDGGEAVQVSD
ncbi:hypothetical protein DFH06DRAFT_1124221 [Mycena polygramma]|nr:hypothetical protein DFH06DRAFT_1124221 [Mycena polygramma]